MLPVLRAYDVEEAVEDAPAHALVVHLEELGADVRLGAAETGQESRLKLHRQLRHFQILISERVEVIMATAPLVHFQRCDKIYVLLFINSAVIGASQRRKRKFLNH